MYAFLVSQCKKVLQISSSVI